MMMDFSQLAVSIDAHRNGEMVLIRPQLDNPLPLTLQYKLSVRQRGANGESNISQRGEVQSGVASGTTISMTVPAGADCVVHLEVFKDDVLVKAVERSCDGTELK